MEIIFNKIFLEHNTGIHPENKNRFSLFKSLKDTELKSGEKHLKLGHTKEYIEHVKQSCKMEQPLDPDTPTCKKSYEAACYAVSASILASKKQAFALVRPPGHHATRDRGMGFCIFNNMAITAKYNAKQNKKIFILDIDIHHGNGTEDIIKGDKNILYASIHQNPLYPGTGLKSTENCINIPLPPGIRDEQYIKALETHIAPAIRKFNPDIIGVSAGFDAYYKDAGYVAGNYFFLTGKTYKRIKQLLEQYKVFYVLEGGYNPESVYEGVKFFID